MPKYSVTLYNEEDRAEWTRNVYGENAVRALDFGIGTSERERAHKIVVQRVRESLILLPKEREALARLLREARSHVPKSEALGHWIKRLEDD